MRYPTLKRSFYPGVATSIVVLVVAYFAPAAVAEPAWQAHGTLEVADNAHTIEHSDGTPFLWIGDTAWGMFQQLTRDEVDVYLDHRQQLGFSVIQSVAHWSPHGGGLDRGPDNAANAYGHRPFHGSEAAPDTGEPLVVDGGGPYAPNDYWDNVDYVIEAVRQRNMYLALLPTWSAQTVTGTGEFTPEEAKSYGRFLGERYGDLPHLIWVLGGDTKAQFKGYDKNQVEREWDNRQVFRSMAEGLVAGATGAQPGWNEEHAAWDELFLTYHPDGDAAFNSSNWFHGDAWLDANGVEVWKEVDDVYRTMLDDYQREEPVKPSLFLEGSYEYGTYRHECGWVTPVRVRRQLYHTFFAGGAGHTYGAGPIWAMRGNGGRYNCGYTWQQALDFPGAYQVAVLAREFLEEHQWYQWVPDGNVIAGWVAEGDSLKTGVTVASGELVLAYFSNNSETRIRNTLPLPAAARWFNPIDGNAEPAGQFAPGEIRSMTPPSRWEDAILVLRATGQ